MSAAIQFHPTFFAWTAAGLSAILFLAVLSRWEFSGGDRSFLFLILCNLGWDIGYIFSWPFENASAPPYLVMFGSACLLPGAFLDFLVYALAFADRRPVFVAYGIGTVLAGWGLANGITNPWKISLWGFIASFTLAAFGMTWTALRSTHPVVRFRARYLIIAILAASVGGLADLAQGIGGHPPAAGVLGGAIALAILAVATARLEVVATHPLALDVTVYGAMAAVYAGLAFLLSRTLTPVWSLSVISAFAVVTVRPASEALTLFLKRVLLGIRQEPAEVLRTIRSAILFSRMESELVQNVCGLIGKTFGLDHCAFLSDRSRLSLQEIEFLSKGHVMASDLERLPSGAIKAYSQSGQLAVALGFFRDGAFVGALLLSPKKNGRRFFPDDIRLLETIGEELTFAHENLRLSRRERLAKLGEAIAVVSHEIKNPLTTLIGSAEILRTGKVTPELREIGNHLFSELRRLKNLVNEYLDFARPFDIRPTRFDLAALVREVTRPLESAGIRVELNGEIPIHADESGIRHVLLNLIQNAKDAGANAPVAISVFRDNADAVVQVKDSGPGLDKSIRGREFEPFVTSKSGGTGLGLAICKHIIDAHGGKISLSDHSGGATAEFRLSAASDSAKRA